MCVCVCVLECKRHPWATKILRNSETLFSVSLAQRDSVGVVSTNWNTILSIQSLEKKIIASFALRGECPVKVKYPHHILGSTMTVAVPFIANGKEQAPPESHYLIIR